VSHALQSFVADDPLVLFRVGVNCQFTELPSSRQLRRFVHDISKRCGQISAAAGWWIDFATRNIS